MNNVTRLYPTPATLPDGGKITYAEHEDGFGRQIIVVSVWPVAAEPQECPCDSWRIASIYAAGWADGIHNGYLGLGGAS